MLFRAMFFHLRVLVEPKNTCCEQNISLQVAIQPIIPRLIPYWRWGKTSALTFFCSEHMLIQFNTIMVEYSKFCAKIAIDFVQVKPNLTIIFVWNGMEFNDNINLIPFRNVMILLVPHFFLKNFRSLILWKYAYIIN